MSIERAAAFGFAGGLATLVGPELKVGDKAPEFTATGTNLAAVKSGEYAGKVRIISSVPSLDTGVCDTQTRRFNQEAAGLGENVVVLTLSMDLPFAQKRWCGAAGVDRVVTLSDFREATFGAAYGTLMKEWRLLSRAVFVVDSQDNIVHVEYCKAGGEQPNYDAALEAAKAAK